MIRHRESPPTSFDTETGILFRSEDKKPAAPEIIDLCCTNSCHAGCQFCYLSAIPEGQHSDLEWIQQQILSLPEMPFEIAIGGGEPTAWPYLLDFINWCREQGIVPNAAIGPAANKDIAKQILKKDQLGSIGISVVPGMVGSLELLRLAKEHTEIPVRAHCIMRKDWLEDWKAMAGILPHYVGGVVFLNFKPHGRGLASRELVPSLSDIQEIFTTYNISIGFDSCSSCALRHLVPKELIDECDGGKYSMFIDGVEQKFSQCSFLDGTPFGDIMLDEAWRNMEHIPVCKYAAKELK